MALGFTVLLQMVLVLAGGLEGGGSAKKLVREFGFVLWGRLVL